MKTIEIKNTSIKNDSLKNPEVNIEEKPFVDYADFIKVCVNHIIKGGFSTDQIRKRARILEALEKQKDGKIILIPCIKEKAFGKE